MESERMIYKSPVDKKGKPYWVPVVIKNKDTLVGILKGMAVVIQAFDIPPSESVTPIMGSDRFNDLLPNGKHIHNMSDNEYIEYLKEAYLTEPEEHPDNNVTMGYFMQVQCTCGNFHGFKTFKDVPSENLVCELCGHTMIDYTGHDDHEYKFDGQKTNVQQLVNDMSDAMYEEYEDDEYDDEDEEE